MEIELILSNIFSYLPLKDFKNARAVNKFWNSVSLPAFKKKTKLSITIDYENDRENYKLLKFKYEMRNSVAYENLWLELHTKDAVISNFPEGWKPLPTQLGFVLYFFTKYFKPIVKTLVFPVRISNRNDFELAYDILQILSPTLESIELSFIFYINKEDKYDEEEDVLHLKKNVQFPKLKYLSINIGEDEFSDRNYDEDTYDQNPNYEEVNLRYALHFQNILEEICKGAPNIQTMKSDCASSQLFHSLKNPNILGKLKTLNLDQFGVYKPHPRMIKDICKTVKCLEINYTNPGPSCLPMKALELLMKKNKSSLQQLEIEFCPYYEKYNISCQPPIKEIFKFTTFPLLESLNLFWASDVEIQFLFPRNSIQYSADFPCLKTLAIGLLGNYGSDLNQKGCLKKNYDSFFPRTKQVCKSLRLLKIQKYCISGRCSKCNMDWELDKNKDLKEMFPFASIVYKENRW